MTAEDVPEAIHRQSAAMLRGFRHLFGSEPDEPAEPATSGADSGAADETPLASSE